MGQNADIIFVLFFYTLFSNGSNGGIVLWILGIEVLVGHGALSFVCWLMVSAIGLTAIVEDTSLKCY